MEDGLLEKWTCLSGCGESFLVDSNRSEGKDLLCPYCGKYAEAVARQNPDADLETQLEGCLWPL
jgi:sarcosine oxidase delta subunit